MRRPHATTVSAVRMTAGALFHCRATTRALVLASLKPYDFGVSFLRMDSSMAAPRTASGMIPIWASKALRRGLSLPRTSGTVLLEAIGNAPLGEVIGGHLHHDLIACQNADPIFAHLAGRVGDDFVAVLQHHAKRGIR